MKIALMADSTGYLPQDFMDQYEIPIAPLSVADVSTERVSTARLLWTNMRYLLHH